MHVGRRPSIPTRSDPTPSAPLVESGSPDASGARDQAWDGRDRRRRDRRERPTRPWTGLLTPRRRSGGRRASDRRGYVDRYSRTDVTLLLTIFVLNIGDAFFTMLWLGRGGREANPVMDFFLDIGPWAFLAQKCIVVGLWLIILVVHKNYRLARLGLYSALVVYGLLMLVHFAIVALDIQPPPTIDESTHGLEARDSIGAGYADDPMGAGSAASVGGMGQPGRNATPVGSVGQPGSATPVGNVGEPGITDTGDRSASG